MSKPDWWDERAVDDGIRVGLADPPDPPDYMEDEDEHEVHRG